MFARPLAQDYSVAARIPARKVHDGHHFIHDPGMARLPSGGVFVAAPCYRLVLISRTSKDAPNQHDADLVTFHRVGGFRSLALNLYPELSGGS